MSESNEGVQPLFETLTSDLPGDVVAQANRLMEEMDGRTPYGQLGPDGILRSTRNEYASTDDMPIETTLPQPETTTGRKRPMVKVKVAEKVLPSGDIVTSHPGTGAKSEVTSVKSNGKRRRKRTGRGAAGPSMVDQENSQAWYGLDENHPDFLDQLLVAQEHSQGSKPN